MVNPSVDRPELLRASWARTRDRETGPWRYQGLLIGSGGTVAWRCAPSHDSPLGAMRCAQDEEKRRRQWVVNRTDGGTA